MAKQYVIMQDSPWSAGFKTGDIVEFRPEGNKGLKWICVEGSCVGDRWSMPDPDETGERTDGGGDLAYMLRPEKAEPVVDVHKVARQIIALQSAGIMARAFRQDDNYEKAEAWRKRESDAYDRLAELGIPVENPHK